MSAVAAALLWLYDRPRLMLGVVAVTLALTLVGVFREREANARSVARINAVWLERARVADSAAKAEGDSARNARVRFETQAASMLAIVASSARSADSSRALVARKARVADTLRALVELSRDRNGRVTADPLLVSALGAIDTLRTEYTRVAGQRDSLSTLATRALDAATEALDRASQATRLADERGRLLAAAMGPIASHGGIVVDRATSTRRRFALRPVLGAGVCADRSFTARPCAFAGVGFTF